MDCSVYLGCLGVANVVILMLVCLDVASNYGWVDFILWLLALLVFVGLRIALMIGLVTFRFGVCFMILSRSNSDILTHSLGMLLLCGGPLGIDCFSGF